MSKIELVLKHLQTNKTITPLEAMNKYHYYRLSDGIWKLRARGFNIVTHKETFGEDEYAKYELIEDEESAA